MPQIFRVLICVVTLLTFTHCGRTSRLAVKADRASSGDTLGNGTNNTPSNSLVCQLLPSSTVVTVPVNASGQLYPGYLPAPISFNAQGTVAGVPSSIQIPSGLPADGFAMVTSPVAQANSSIQFSMRPLRLGTTLVKFPIVNSQSLTANCEVNITVNGVQPPDLTISLSADGAFGNVSTPFTSGQTSIINWSSNGNSCILKDGNTVMNSYTAPYGEFTTVPLTNTTPNPIQKVYSATCTGGPLNETKTVTVTLTINPGLNAVLNIAGTAARTTTVPTGGAVTLNWTSQFATRGCILGDGVNSSPVAVNGTIQIQNIAQAVTWTLACWDTVSMKTSSVQIQTVLPVIGSFTANGIATRATIPFASAVTLSWTTTDVHHCELNPGLLPVGENTTRSVTVAANTTFTLTCQSAIGPLSKTVVVDVTGAWINAYGQTCSTFCTGRGLVNKQSPEGAYCTSGENVAASAIGIIEYKKGCWGSCTVPGDVRGATSNRESCYTPELQAPYKKAQKQDWDRTDITTGCFCG